MKKIIDYLQQNPKKTFLIMAGLICISIAYSIYTYIDLKKSFKEEKNTISLSKEYKQTLNNTVKTVDELKRIANLKTELDKYRVKRSLTAQDSLRIKYLIEQITDEENKL